jgi:hypothetical protein
MKGRRSNLTNFSPEQREHIAENMKERIYATITLLAVMTGLWQSANTHTVVGSVLIVIGTVVALWLATLISARMSYRAIHSRPMIASEYRKLLFTSSGLFAPTLLPVLLICFSATNIISLKTALMTGMIILAVSLFVLSFIGGWRIYDNRLRLLFVSSLEMLLGVGVIVLKLVLGE